MTNTTTFDVDTINIFTTCMQSVFESYYKQFDPTIFNRFSKPFKTTIPNKLIWFINDFLKNNIDMQLLEDTSKKLYPNQTEISIGESKEQLQQYFRAIFESEQFKTALTNWHKSNPVLDSSALDKTTGLEVYAQFGHHTDAIYTILASHPEFHFNKNDLLNGDEDKIERQNEFVMNHITLRGNKANKDWYDTKIPIIHPEESNKHSNKLDIHATLMTVLKEYETIFHLNLPEENLIRVELDDGHFSYKIKTFNNINNAIKWSKKMGASLADFMDDIIDLADEFDQTLDPKILMEDYTKSNFEIIDFCKTDILPIEKSVPWIFIK